jgi:hypothetical protein
MRDMLGVKTSSNAYADSSTNAITNAANTGTRSGIRDCGLVSSGILGTEAKEEVKAKSNII